MSRVARLAAERQAPLLGAAACTYNPIFAEMVAKVGLDLLWIEMEHAHITFPEAGDLCRIASGLGLLTMIRVPDSSRQNVLWAAELGPDILDLPMANSPDVVEELVRYGKFAPVGERGSFSGSRAANYGFGAPYPEQQQRINEDLCLMIQIETKQAVERAEELCSVPGLDAILIGPGDLSASLGLVGQGTHPEVLAAADRAIAVAKSHGKLVAVAGAPEVWAPRGADVIFFTTDVGCTRAGLVEACEKARETVPAPNK